MKIIRNFSVLVLVLALLSACSDGNKANNESSVYDGMDSRQKTRMQQYYRLGKTLYMTHCSNCHQPDGKGLGQLYPPLAKSDYLMKDPVKTVCIIKNGLEGEIIVNGKTYNQPMPAHDNLTNIEIAEIITYISNSWGNQSGLHDVNTIEKASAECSK